MRIDGFTLINKSIPRTPSKEGVSFKVVTVINDIPFCAGLDSGLDYHFSGNLKMRSPANRLFQLDMRHLYELFSLRSN